MDVSKNCGTPKWMVKIMENPIKMDDLGGPPLFLETPTCVRGVSLLSIHSTLDHFERFVDFDPISIPGLKTHPMLNPCRGLNGFFNIKADGKKLDKYLNGYFRDYVVDGSILLMRLRKEGYTTPEEVSTFPT